MNHSAFLMHLVALLLIGCLVAINWRTVRRLNALLSALRSVDPEVLRAHIIKGAPPYMNGAAFAALADTIARGMAESMRALTERTKK